MDKILEESEEALKASLHDEAPPRERKPLGLIGFSLKLEGSGDKKYGIQWDNNNGLTVSAGNKTVGVGLDSQGRITLDGGGLKLKINPESDASSDGPGPSNSVGVLPFSADREGMLKLELLSPSFKTPIGGIKFGPEVGFNPIEGASRLVDPGVQPLRSLNLLLYRSEALDHMGEARSQIQSRISALQQIPGSWEYYEFRNLRRNGI